jgi:predicted cobalt transporter CbtA
MLRNLLVCGLLAGLVAGLLAAGFASLAGEPAVDQAIAFEEANAPPGEEEEPPPVARSTQKGLGLVTASTVYGLAFGGIFALVFAYVYGRVAHAGPGRTALWLAAAGFVVIFLVPFVKYPPNPPAVGDPGSIGERTALYIVMVWISIFAAMAAVRLRRALAQRRPAETATLLAGAAYLALVVAAGLAMPSVQEVPDAFPATTLWRFREASLGTQLVMWSVLGLGFAAGAQRVMTGRPVFPARRPGRGATAAARD